jgi:ATP-binding cassette, subfamily C (CFTR/MRP), member 1
MERVGDPSCLDDSFGPWAGPICRYGFDFTLLFEESILCLLLQGLFLLCLPVRLYGVFRMDFKAVPAITYYLKMVSGAGLAFVNLSLVVMWAWTSDDNIFRTRATVACATVTFAASLGATMLSSLEHSRTYRPSFLLCIYLYLSLLLDLPRLRTLWMLGAKSNMIPVLFTVSFGMRVVLALLESLHKRNLLIPPHNAASHEKTRGPISTASFAWLFPLLFSGYTKVLRHEELYPLDDWLFSRPLHETLLAAWRKLPNRAAPGTLLSTMISVYSGAFWSAAIPRLICIGFTYSQPFLIQTAVEYASTPAGQPWNNYGYGLIGAFFLVYTGMAIATAQYSWHLRRWISIARAGLVGLIASETLEMDINAPGANPTAALALASGDTDIAQQGMYQLHEIWASLVEIAVADYLIYRQMGAACAMPIAVAIGESKPSSYLPPGT